MTDSGKVRDNGSERDRESMGGTRCEGQYYGVIMGMVIGGVDK